MKSFVQYGAGNIGRGFIGQLFSEAGYFVHFIDVDPDLINSLNNQKRYPINIVSNLSNRDVWIENVDCINAIESETVAEAIANCDLMATAVGVNILPRIVPNIVAGFRKRIESGNENPLNIIICENLIDADKLLYKLIKEILSDGEIVVFKEKVGLVEASVGRMVPVMTVEQKRDNLLRVFVESYCELPIDKAAFKGEVPNVPNLLPFMPFEYYIKRKLFIHNMGHALTAYLGSVADFEFIWQAINNPAIRRIVGEAMNESAEALSKKFGISSQSVNKHIEDLIDRFGNAALRDTVQRVGRDPFRKLSSNDRFAGAIKLCEEQGSMPVFIPIGIAAGLLFECDDDAGTKIIKDKLLQGGIDGILKEVCELKDNINNIKVYYDMLKKHPNLECLIKQAEIFKFNI